MGPASDGGASTVSLISLRPSGRRPAIASHRLHRAVGDDARYRYANVVIWESAEAWRAAHDEGFRKLVAQPGWREFSQTRPCYKVVHTGDQAAPAFGLFRRGWRDG